MIRTDTPSTVMVVVVSVDEELEVVDDDEDIDDNEESFDFFLKAKRNVCCSPRDDHSRQYFFLCTRSFRSLFAAFER